MASAWGNSWGNAWGNSWGSVDGVDTGSSEVDPKFRQNLIGPHDRVENPTLITRLYDMLELGLNGRTRNIVEITLTANAASTTVETVPSFESHQIPVLVPLSQSAAAELAAGTIWISSRSNGSFVITHSNSAVSDRTFGCVFVG